MGEIRPFVTCVLIESITCSFVMYAGTFPQTTMECSLSFQ